MVVVQPLHFVPWIAATVVYVVLSLRRLYSLEWCYGRLEIRSVFAAPLMVERIDRAGRAVRLTAEGKELFFS